MMLCANEAPVTHFPRMVVSSDTYAAMAPELTTKVAVWGWVPLVKLVILTAGAVDSGAFLSSAGNTSQVLT